jgi:hypothetical protein
VSKGGRRVSNMEICLGWVVRLVVLLVGTINSAGFLYSVRANNVQECVIFLLALSAMMASVGMGLLGSHPITKPTWQILEESQQYFERERRIKEEREALAQRNLDQKGRKRDKLDLEALVIEGELDFLGPEEGDTLWPNLDGEPQVREQEGANGNKVAEVDWADDGAVPV